jgi:hypothetical protein
VNQFDADTVDVELSSRKEQQDHVNTLLDKKQSQSFKSFTDQLQMRHRLALPGRKSFSSPSGGASTSISLSRKCILTSLAVVAVLLFLLETSMIVRNRQNTAIAVTESINAEVQSDRLPHLGGFDEPEVGKASNDSFHTNPL